MPMDTVLLSLAICFVFGLFAFVLAWADYTTTGWQKKNSRVERPDAVTKKAA